MLMISYHFLISFNFKGHNCIVSGWGRQASGGATKPDTLQKVNQSMFLFIGYVYL